MTNIINLSVVKSKNPIINELKKNKKGYFALEEKIRYDYNFMQEVFHEFEYDLDFLDSILKDINKNVEEDWKLEFNLIYVDLLERKRHYNINGYFANGSPIMARDLKITLYSITIETLSSMLMEKLNKIIEGKNIDDVGMGFIVIQDMFSYSEIIKNYYAEVFIRKIFQNPKLESYLHNNYSEFTDIEKIGVTSFIINYIAKRDEALASYVINHQEVLEEINYALECIKLNWQIFNMSVEKQMFSQIGEEVYSYVRKNINSDNLHERITNIETFWEATNYAAYQFGILDGFFSATIGYDDKYVKELKAQFASLDFDSKSFMFKKYYEDVKNMIKRNLEQSKINPHLKLK